MLVACCVNAGTVTLKRSRRAGHSDNRWPTWRRKYKSCARLSHRLAELTDLVQEILVPAVGRDDERLRRLLDDYDPGH